MRKAGIRMNTTKANQGKMDSKQNALQLLKFVGFSCTAGVIQVIAFSLLSELAHLSYWPAYLAALILSVVYNFTVNRRYTFRSTANIPLAMLKVFGYYCVFTPLSTIVGDYLADVCLWNTYIVLGLCMVANFLTEFLFYRLVVYKSYSDSKKE